jgi:hypothetical protein
MLARKYSPLQRRALNQIWAAAKDYSFEPPFMAFAASGEPDFYMNCIIGLACKWFGRDTLSRLFESYAGDFRAEMFDALIWLGLENSVFQKEAANRPALQNLRQEYAEAYFAQEYQLSRQQWMAKNNLVYALQSARWKSVLGRRGPLLSPRESLLAAALAFPGEMRAEELPGAVQDILRRYFLFGGEMRGVPPLRLHFSDRWAALLTKLLPTEMVRSENLRIEHPKQGIGSGFHQAPCALRAITTRASSGDDRRYIESCFGKCLFSPRQMQQIEQELCTGNHFQTRLWFASGRPSAKSARTSEEKYRAAQAELQKEANKKHFEAHRELYRSCILRLSGEIENCLMVHRQTCPEQARSGSLDGRRVWRAARLQDEAVFTRQAEAPDAGLRVDLMLDASASRLHCQETIAAQGYILAESLRLCHIPVQVSSFCSLRGYTILKIYQKYEEPERSSEIFRYFAAGWNRDGLALKAQGYLIDSDPSPARHLLILLTDANPNDSTRIPSSAGHPLSRDYGDRDGIEDTAEQIRALRHRGIRVAAVFFGEDSSLPAAQRLYGHDFVRIQRMDLLASAVGRLIERQLDLLD